MKFFYIFKCILWKKIFRIFKGIWELWWVFQWVYTLQRRKLNYIKETFSSSMEFSVPLLLCCFFHWLELKAILFLSRLQHRNVRINTTTITNAESIVMMEHPQQTPQPTQSTQQQVPLQQSYPAEYHHNGTILAKLTQMLDQQQRTPDVNFKGIVDWILSLLCIILFEFNCCLFLTLFDLILSYRWRFCYKLSPRSE